MDESCESGLDTITSTLPSKEAFHITNGLLYHSGKVCVPYLPNVKQKNLQLLGFSLISIANLSVEVITVVIALSNDSSATYKLQIVEFDVVVGDNVIVDSRLPTLVEFRISNVEIEHRLYHVGHPNIKQFQSHNRPRRSTIALAFVSKCE